MITPKLTLTFNHFLANIAVSFLQGASLPGLNKSVWDVHRYVNINLHHVISNSDVRFEVVEKLANGFYLETIPNLPPEFLNPLSIQFWIDWEMVER